MNGADRDLEARLAAADAASPPPAGAAITPWSLLAADARRRRHQLAGVAALSLLALLVFAWPRAPRAHDDDVDGDGAIQQQLAQLRRDVQTRQDRLAGLVTVLPAPDGGGQDANLTLRYELANARANAVLARASSPKENR